MPHHQNHQRHDYRDPAQAVRQHRLSSVAGSRHSSRRLSSPLDFTDSIPFNELKLSTETLGSGSFGTVYKGRWRSLDVAVKHFKTREEIDSFSVEVKQLSRVRHPNIVKLYGASSPSKTAAYLIMEYAEGGSLSHLLHDCRHQDYDLRHACSWAMQTARGVAYLHSLRPKPIMHRDLKPANLLLFERGKILKICDFGTACAVKTQMTNNTGSASYMAPEVFSTSSYLESGDVFSWSIIFWEILVRQQPYYKQYSNPFQILWWVNNGTRPKQIEDCPEIIWNLITRSWDKNPNMRPTMKQVAQEMEFIFSLARSSDNESDVETKSLPRTPEEVTTPTNSTNPLAQKCEQVHSRYKAFVNRFITSSNFKKSPLAQESSGASPSVSSVYAAQDALEHQEAMIDQDNLSHVDIMAHENVSQNSYNQIDHYEQRINRVSQDSTRSTSTNSHHPSTASTQMKAFMRHIALLKARCDELEEELRCDKKNSAAESFKEFTDLKINIEKLRALVREGSGSGASTTECAKARFGDAYHPPTPPPTNHGPHRSHNNLQIHDYENAPPHIVNENS